MKSIKNRGIALFFSRYMNVVPLKGLIILSLIFISTPNFINAQNLLRNPGFESDSPVFPTAHGQIQAGLCSFWTGATEGTDGVGGTSDWYKSTGNFHRPQEEITPGNFTDITAADGSGFAGMYAREMIQQQLEAPLNSKGHKLTMWIRTSSYPMRWVAPPNPPVNASLGTALDASGGQINVFAASSKIMYNGANAICPTPNLLKNGNNLELLGSVTIDPALYAPNQWIKVEIGLKRPSNANLNWIGFEFDSCPGYIMMDNIELEEVPCDECNIRCSPFDGCIEPLFYNLTHGIDAPFSIGGLNNISYLKLEIMNVLGSPPIRTIEINSPYPIVSWDGENDAGVEVGAQTYFFHLTLSNSCDEYFVNQGQILKINAGATITSMTKVSPHALSEAAYPKRNILDKCCFQDIHITTSDVTYINPPLTPEESDDDPKFNGQTTIQAINTISFDPFLWYDINSQTTFIAAVQPDPFSVPRNGDPFAEIIPLSKECDATVICLDQYLNELDFQFEDGSGNQQSFFCWKEDVYINASANFPAFPYELELAIFNPALQVWETIADEEIEEMPGSVNITSLFENDPDGAVTFEDGQLYKVIFVFNHDGCDIVRIDHEFSYDYEVIAAFLFEDQLGNVREEFCSSERVFINGSASIGEERYYLEVSRAYIGSNNFNFLAAGWTQGEIGLVDLTDWMLNKNWPLVGDFIYQVKLGVQNDTGCNPWVEKTHRFILNDCCEAPKWRSCSTFDDDVFITWEDASPISTYRLFIDTKTGICCGNEDLMLPQGFLVYDNKYNISNIEAKCFAWRVQTICGEDDESDLSPYNCITPSTICFGLKLRNNSEPGLNESMGQPILAISPNPVRDLLKINLTLPAPSAVKLQILNMNGQLIKKFETHEVHNDIYNQEWTIPSSLTKGVYIIKATTSWGEVVEKVILLE